MNLHSLLIVASLAVCGFGCKRNPSVTDNPQPTNVIPTAEKKATGIHTSNETARSSNGSAVVNDSIFSSQQQHHFQNVTAHTGVNFSFSSGREAGEFAIIESLGGGIGILDYDLDGRLDMHLAGGGTLFNRTVASRPCGLFRNLGQWHFSDATDQAGASALQFYTHGVFPGDWDNDGFDDLAISGYGGIQLLHNQGDGTFVQIPTLVSHPQHPWSASLSWADFDNDGVLDLYVAHYVDWSWDKNPVCPGISVAREVCPPREFAAVSDAIYFGVGDGSFRRCDKDVGLVEGGKGLGVVAADVDGDADVDIYVANDTTDNFFYINNGHGHFDESAVSAGLAGDEAGVSTGSMGTCVFDANDDGLPDVWTVNFERELFALYRNESGGAWSHNSRAAGFGAIEGSYVGFGTVAIDFDHDGDLDLVVANGHVSYASPHASFKQLPLLLKNVNGRFTKCPPTDYFAETHTGRGLAYGDFDDDGALDLVVSHLEEPVAILRGQIARPKTVSTRLRLIGTTSNRNAIGAVVRTATRRIVMHNGGGSYLSTSDSRLWLTGLDPSKPVAFEVSWPSGKKEVWTLTDGEGILPIVEGRSMSPGNVTLKES